MSTEALERAIEKAGGQTALAELISTPERPYRQQHIWWWLHQANGRVPAPVAPLIERATGVPKHDLRPDVFEKPLIQDGAGQQEVAA